MRGGLRSMVERLRKSRWVVLGLVAGTLAAPLGCSYDPQYQSGVTRCASPAVAKRCPTGYSCNSQGFCVLGQTSINENGGSDGGLGSPAGGAGGGPQDAAGG